ncbi:unnamed protein product [Adineta steineri]|uniref:Riboflavin transporter n=1 Tax=Adineta steineri TaxID=433720 RepID=A0A814II47_9BILA|nr:unnamed protein product [Adineta steineri]
MGSYKIENTTIIVFILITIFSLCQNILFYGIFIELPVIVDRLPEGWSLPATFNLITGKAGLFWGCVMVQSGTFLGASFGYIFTVHFSFFKERFPCVDYIC